MAKGFIHVINPTCLTPQSYVPSSLLVLAKLLGHATTNDIQHMIQNGIPMTSPNEILGYRVDDKEFRLPFLQNLRKNSVDSIVNTLFAQLWATNKVTRLYWDLLYRFGWT